MELVNLKEKDPDAKRFTPEQALQVILDDYKNGLIKGTKIVIVTLDETNGLYHIDRAMAGVHGQEAVSMLEAAKFLLLKEAFE